MRTGWGGGVDWGFVFRVSCFGVQVFGFGFWVSCFVFRVSGSGILFPCFGIRDLVLGFRDLVIVRDDSKELPEVGVIGFKLIRQELP